MYKKTDPQMSFIDDFYIPFGGFLRSNNRWVILARNIPWEAIEAKYASLFSDVGQPAKPIRMAVGSLIIKERMQFSDEELVLQVAENHYLQYFLGLKAYQDAPPFDPSVLTKWRKRFTADILKDINRMIIEAQKAKQTPPPSGGAPRSSGEGEDRSAGADNRPNAGKMIIDATCAPADIKYPTDIGLLSDAREKLEELIDLLHAPLRNQSPKPRTYRQKARRIYLNIAKQKQPRSKSVRKAIGKQLRYIARDLRIIQALQKQERAAELTQRQQQYLETIRTLYSQQHQMHQDRSHRIQDRIVSLHQPHVRPIVRGKARDFVEFGAKMEISVVDGYGYLEKLSWDAYNEGSELIGAIERYRQDHGCYPEAVLADRIYRNRTNLAYCKEKGIRLSGPRLGRPPKLEGDAGRIARQDNRERNAVEGKFGEGKRRYGLGRIMARLPETSGSVIAMQLLVMNLEKILRDLFGSILDRLFCSWIRCLSTMRPVHVG